MKQTIEYTMVDERLHEIGTFKATQAMAWHRAGEAVTVTRYIDGVRVSGVVVDGAPVKDRNENRHYCKHIADELDEYAAGAVRKCPNCGELHAREWDEVGDSFKCPHCGDVDNPGEWEVLSLWDYMNDEVLDTTWIIDSNREYSAARFYVTLGGPSCWIDTERHTVELRWGGESACYGLSWDTVEALDEYAAELWEMGY